MRINMRPEVDTLFSSVGSGSVQGDNADSSQQSHSHPHTGGAPSAGHSTSHSENPLHSTTSPHSMDATSTTPPPPGAHHANHTDPAAHNDHSTHPPHNTRVTSLERSVSQTTEMEYVNEDGLKTLRHGDKWAVDKVHASLKRARVDSNDWRKYHENSPRRPVVFNGKWDKDI